MAPHLQFTGRTLEQDDSKLRARLEFGFQPRAGRPAGAFSIFDILWSPMETARDIHSPSKNIQRAGRCANMIEWHVMRYCSTSMALCWIPCATSLIRQIVRWLTLASRSTKLMRTGTLSAMAWSDLPTAPCRKNDGTSRRWRRSLLGLTMNTQRAGPITPALFKESPNS